MRRWNSIESRRRTEIAETHTEASKRKREEMNVRNTLRCELRTRNIEINQVRKCQYLGENSISSREKVTSKSDDTLH